MSATLLKDPTRYFESRRGAGPDGVTAGVPVPGDHQPL